MAGVIYLTAVWDAIAADAGGVGAIADTCSLDNKIFLIISFSFQAWKHIGAQKLSKGKNSGLGRFGITQFKHVETISR